MDSLVQRIFVSTAGLIFAVVGFSLSVFATALAALVPVQSTAYPVKHPSPRGIARSLNSRGRLVRLSDRPSTSSNPSTPASSIPSTPKNTDSDSNTKVSIRSQSPSSFRQHEQPHHPLLKPMPTTDFPPLDNSTTPPPTSCETSREAGRQGFKLRKLKPNWGERRPDDKPKIQRCFSSPVHTSPSLPKPSVIVRQKSSKNLRKTASVPSALSPKSCTLEKKKSQPLRTQPYEAPYFFPPPIPVERPPSRGKLPPSRPPPVPPLPKGL